MTEQAIEVFVGAQATASVIWLHGLGADGQDFVPVVQMLDLPNIRFILPHAPYRSITINNGAEMRAWYDVFGLTHGSPEDEKGIRETQTYIESLIEAEIAKGIPSERVMLAGFSQGGAIVLQTALRYKKTLAGIIALSTYLPLKSSFKNEKSFINQKMPIFMAHGTDDEVISLDTCQVSLALLQTEQYTVEWHEYTMGHSVCLDEINDIRAFLRAALSI